MNARLKRALLATLPMLLALGLGGCQPKPGKPAATPTAPAAVVDATGAIRYQIDGAASTLHILVYRGGPMARLGHNHVVSSENVSGTLLLRSELRLSRLDLTLPVATVVVDDPVARALEGSEFADEVPPDAREGTRQNLLRAEVLDAEHYPEITLKSVAVSGTRSSASLIMQIAIKGVSRDIPVLAAVREDGNLLIAEGEFAIRQTDFGIAPFSVALGALQVQDQLRIKFTIVARRQQ